MSDDDVGIPAEPPCAEELEDQDGLLLIPAGGAVIDDELVRSLRAQR